MPVQESLFPSGDRPPCAKASAKQHPISIAAMMKRLFGVVAVAATTEIVAAVDTLYVASYAGLIHQLTLSGGETGSLQHVGATSGCGVDPAWLELDPETGVLYCSNEAFDTTNDGSLSAFSLDQTPPAILANTSTIHGPVFSTVYAPDRIALAHYLGSAVSVFDTSDQSTLKEIQSFPYTMDAPGPNPTRQEAPHPHQIIPDPTGKFLVSPDLGADFLRLYRVAPDSSLIELEPFSVTPGAGPRHGVFVQLSGKTYYYLMEELSNGLAGYEVTYGSDTINFEQIYSNSTFQDGYGTGANVIAPAEIVAPEPNHLVISVRNDSSSTYNGQPSDTLISYEIDCATGDLTLLGTTPSGGSFPRGFELHSNGTLLAVANQHSGTVLIYERDVSTGVLADSPLATWTTVEGTASDGNLVSIVWA